MGSEQQRSHTRRKISNGDRLLRWGSIVLLVAVLSSSVGALQAQEGDSSADIPVSTSSPAPDPSSAEEAGVFFADVLVRGNAVFQVGSLSDLSASERAEIISRRIAGLISQKDAIDPVTIQMDSQRNVALLQVNNRVLMTVTQQDALDFNATLEELAQQRADALNEAFDQPSLAVDVVQRLNGTIRTLSRDTIGLLPSLLGVLVIAFITWLMAILVRRLGLLWAEQTEGDRGTEILIGRLCYGAVWGLGTIVSLGVLGLNFGTLLGTLGLTSVAIGFSLKDVLSNYISGVILLAARPFRIQDQVVIGEYEGTVTQIQLRATTMRTYDGRLVYIPNQKVFQSSIINNTASPVRQSSVIVGIDYDADLTTACQVISEVLGHIDAIEPEPPPVVLVRELAASTVNLEVRFWVNSRRRSFLQVSSAAAQAVKEQLQSEGIEMPTEIYTLTFRDMPEILDGKLPSDVVFTEE